MEDNEIAAKGWSVPIYRAVEAAGGPVAVAAAMGLAAATTPMHWYKARSIKAAYVLPLCRLGNYKIDPRRILEDLAAAAVSAQGEDPGECAAA